MVESARQVPPLAQIQPGAADLHPRTGDRAFQPRSATNIEVAKIHARQSGVSVDYRATTSEALSADGETFDIILNMEVVEHVADVELYLHSCAAMLRPGGLMFIATINRTMKAYALAIVGAEYVLGWLPKGTHTYEKLVRPDEIRVALAPTGLDIIDTLGVTFNPLTDVWGKSRDIDVNYMMLTKRPSRAAFDQVEST
jgi:2-polyprenyl-6-hydroxyphenyl methylase / 3-demethylubiquinone-9 3-methyltransferase